MKAKRTQEQLVIEFIFSNGESTIDAIQDGTEILRPNVRRILGQGVLRGKFQRVSIGVYTITNERGNVAYIETADALEALPRLIDQSWKFDLVFLDIPYYSKAVIGGNRGVKYELISAGDFLKVMQLIKELVRTVDSHVYLMVSGTILAQVEIEEYIGGVYGAGFKLVMEGKYRKTFKDGRPVTNVRGKEASHERLILYTLSGNANGAEDLQLDFTVVRPKGYQTEKSPVLLNKLIEQGTQIDGWLLDAFAGSGVAGDEALKLGRNAYLIEKSEIAAEEVILERLITKK